MVFTRFRCWDKPHSDRLHFLGAVVRLPSIPIAHFCPKFSGVVDKHERSQLSHSHGLHAKTLEEFGDVLRLELKPKSPKNAARFAHFQEFDFDPLRHVRHTGRTMVENGFLHSKSMARTDCADHG